MAVPRLRDEKCFLRLDPEKIDDIDHATTIGGSSELGEQVDPEEMGSIELIVSGSVAMAENGERVGKGEGYSDLEFAVLREFGLVDDETTTVTTVHERQVVETQVPTAAHDVPIDQVVTPDRQFRADTPETKPTGVDWEQLDDERVEAIPVLDRLRGG
jgi:5-formyltetrahydrofolate cyclo-ligase